jgi:hypothetical protein
MAVSAARLAIVWAVVSGLGIISAVFTDRMNAATDMPIQWLFDGDGAAAIAADPKVSRLLDSTRPFIMIGRDVPSVPLTWNAVLFASFADFASLRDAVEQGRLGPDVIGVMYDVERWHFTPEDEQRNPAGYVKQAADLAHAHNLLFMTAPAVDLIVTMAPDSRSQQYETYLRLGIAADAALYADVFAIQAQGAETNTELYTNFVRSAAAQARQANPDVMILAGISTEPNGQQVTAGDILRAIVGTWDVVDGYWFNIPRPSEYCPNCLHFRPDIAIEVLSRIAGQ